jgi:hypothetical protein
MRRAGPSAVEPPSPRSSGNTRKILAPDFRFTACWGILEWVGSWRMTMVDSQDTHDQDDAGDVQSVHVDLYRRMPTGRKLALVFNTYRTGQSLARARYRLRQRLSRRPSGDTRVEKR